MSSIIKAIILEGPNGTSFFLRETLLNHGLVEQVDLVNHAEQAIHSIQQHGPYQLVVINLIESWEEGIQLGFWLQQHSSCPVILITTVDTHPTTLPGDPFIVLQTPLSLQDFTACARNTLNIEKQPLQNIDAARIRESK